MGMNETGGMDLGGAQMTERQKKWFSSVQASFETDTGRPLAEWVEIAKGCPHQGPKARTEWLRSEYGLGVNRAAHILFAAFPSGEPGWDDPEALRAQLWKDDGSRAILDALEVAARELPEPLVVGHRKSFTSFSRNVQFAATRPLKGGKARLGLRARPEGSPRLIAPTRTESWSDKLLAWVELNAPGEVDAEVGRLLRAAWERG